MGLGNLIAKLRLDSKQFDTNIKKSSKEIKAIQAQGKSFDKTMMTLTSTVGKFLPVLGGVMTASAAFGKIIETDQVLGDKWRSTQAGLNAAVDTFIFNIAHADFSNFISGLNKSYRAAKNLYYAMDDLNTFKVYEVVDIEKLKNDLQAINDKIRLKRDENGNKLTEEQIKGLEADAQKINAQIQEMLDTATEKLKNARQAALDKAVAETGLDEKDAADYLDNYPIKFDVELNFKNKKKFMEEVEKAAGATANTFSTQFGQYTVDNTKYIRDKLKEENAEYREAAEYVEKWGKMIELYGDVDAKKGANDGRLGTYKNIQSQMNAVEVEKRLTTRLANRIDVVTDKLDDTKEAKALKLKQAIESYNIAEAAYEKTLKRQFDTQAKLNKSTIKDVAINVLFEEKGLDKIIGQVEELKDEDIKLLGDKHLEDVNAQLNEAVKNLDKIGTKYYIDVDDTEVLKADKKMDGLKKKVKAGTKVIKIHVDPTNTPTATQQIIDDVKKLNKTFSENGDKLYIKVETNIRRDPSSMSEQELRDYTEQLRQYNLEAAKANNLIFDTGLLEGAGLKTAAEYSKEIKDNFNDASKKIEGWEPIVVIDDEQKRKLDEYNNLLMHSFGSESARELLAVIDSLVDRGYTFSEAWDLTTQVKQFNDMVDAANGIGDALSTIGDSIEGSTGDVLSWIGRQITAIARLAEAWAKAGITKAAVTGTWPENLIAMASTLAAITAAISSLPKFAHGGEVRGSSYYGDQVYARLNSGEYVLTREQKEDYFKNKKAGGSATINIRMIAHGKDLVGVIDNYNNYNSKIR